MNQNPMTSMFKGIKLRQGALLGVILLLGMFAFELSNYLSSYIALKDVLGELSLIGLKWAFLLAVAFCAVDFAGIARIFTPEQGKDEPVGIWYLFGAWFLAAAFDAILTWWSVKTSLLSRPALPVIMLQTPSLINIVPGFFAVFELLIRVLLINTFVTIGEKIFSTGTYQPRRTNLPGTTAPIAPRHPIWEGRLPRSGSHQASRPTPPAASRPGYNEPTYHPVGMGTHSQKKEKGD